jgi:hypothetical protein
MGEPTQPGMSYWGYSSVTIKAFRSGETAPRWSDDPCKEKLTHKTDQILFNFSMPSKGGGVTEVKLEVTSESFEDVAKAMNDANRNATVRALVRAVPSIGGWELMVQAMMDADEQSTIRAVGRVLQNNKDPAVGACGTILRDKVGGRKWRREHGQAGG